MSQHLERAQLLIQQHRFADAERQLGQALAHDPEDAWAMVLLALCLTERKAHAEASIRAQQAIGLAPDSPVVRRLAGRVELARDNYARAEELFTEAIALDPYDEDAFAGRAAVHASRKHWRKALQDATQALELDPDSTEAMNLRALANRGLGRKGEELQDVQQALREDPTDAASHANLGWSYLHAGDLKNAETHFREALRLNPNLEWARTGVLETTKAKFPVYRWMLAYFLVMAKLTGRAQMAILVGLWLVNRLVQGAIDTYPAWAPVLRPITWFYLLFCVMTWFILPLGNATLLLHPFAKLALNRRERIEALLVGGFFTLVLLLIIGSLFDPTGLVALAALLIGFPALPACLALRFEHPKPRNIMLATAGGVAACAVAACVSIAVEEGAIAMPGPPLEGLVRLGTQLFLFSVPIVLIATNVLAVQTWRQD